MSRTSLPRRAARAAAVALLAVLPVLAGAPAAAAPVARPGPVTVPVAVPAAPEADLVVESVSPAELVPGGSVTITGRVSSGSRALSAVEVTVSRTVSRRSTVFGIDDWLDVGDPPGARRAGPATTELATLAVGDVAADGSGGFAVTLDADDLALGETLQAAGPYGLQLRATTSEEVLDTERGFLVWSPEVAPSPTELLTVAPFVGPAPSLETGLPTGADLAPSVGEGGRLDLLLELATGLGSDWALDPALLAGAVAEAARTGDGAEPGAEAARQWLEALRTGRDGREVVLLDWAVPSAARLVSAPDVDEARDLLDEVQADTLPEETLEELLDGPVREDVLVDVREELDRRQLAVLLDGRDDVLIAEDLVPLLDPSELPYTDDLVTEVGGPDGTVTAVLSSTAMTADAAAAAQGEALATTRLLARLAVTTLQRPNDARLATVLLPADLAPTPEGIRALVSALEGTSWSTPASLPQALGTSPSDLERAPLPRGPALVRDPDVARAFAARAAYGSVATVFVEQPADDDPAAAPVHEGLPVDEGLPADRLLAAALSGLTARAAPDVLADLFATAAEAVVEGVGIVPGSRVTLAAQQAAVPFTLLNQLDRPVRLVLQVRSASARLRVTEPTTTVELQPGVRTVVDVDVEAVANGPAELTAQLHTVDGRPWGEVSRLPIRVATQAEGRVLGIVAGAAALLFAAGSVRAVRVNRRRRALEAAPVPSTGDPAAHP